MTTRFVPYNELCKIEDYFTKKTRLLFLETPTNPTLRCVDIAALAKLGHQKHTCVVVDNTFASPMLQRPLELGADVVVHSATKLLGGHNDVTAGVIAGSADWVEPAREMMKQSGGCLDPLAAYLLIRGLKTLGIRVERATENARRLPRSWSRIRRCRACFIRDSSRTRATRSRRNRCRDLGRCFRSSTRAAARARRSLSIP